MTGNPQERSTPNAVTADLLRRVRRLEAVPAGAGPAYLQSQGAKIAGTDFEAATSFGNFNGGNGATSDGGSWDAVLDATSPFEGYALYTTVDQDWFAFALPTLGPRYTGYAVAVWFYGDTDYGKFDIEWSTNVIDEFGNTSPAYGSATSVLGPNDIIYDNGPDFNWYNTNNLSDGSHTYRNDCYRTGGGVGWQGIIERSPFFLGGADATPLTADGTATGDFEWNMEFNGGGGPDIAWWMRILVNGKNASSSGYKCRIGKIMVYRFNGASNMVSM